MEGKDLWSKKWNSLRTANGWGTAASPVLHKDRLYVVNDNEEKSFLVAIDAATGKDVWRVERDEKSNWATPFVWEYGQRTELITCGSKRVRAYDLGIETPPRHKRGPLRARHYADQLACRFTLPSNESTVQKPSRSDCPMARGRFLPSSKGQRRHRRHRSLFHNRRVAFSPDSQKLSICGRPDPASLKDGEETKGEIQVIPRHRQG